MKKFSKILSVALLVALVLSLGVANAFAAEDDPAYSITITNAVEKETYTAYKMFDLSVDDPENPTAFRYTVNSAWAAFADTAVFKAVFSVDSNGYISSEEASQAAWEAGSKMSDLADAAAKYAAEHNIASAGSVTIEEGKTSGTISLDVPGYYVITSTLGSRAMLQTTPTDPAAQINEKNEGDTTEKEVQEDSRATNPDHGWGDANDAQVGDTVNFKSVTTVVARSIKVKIHDTMDPGLTLNPGSIKVYTTYTDDGNDENDVEYTAATIRAGTGASAPDSGDTFTIDIPDSFAATATASQTLTVLYTAELNKLAIVTDENGNPVIDPATNDTHVTFGDHGSSEHDTTDTTTHKFEVHKYKGGDTESILADAVFQVLKNGTVVNLVKLDAHNYRVVDDTETTAPVSHANNGELKTIAAGTIVSDFVTVADANIVIWGVDSDSDYSLHEVQPPKGYNACADTAVTVNADNGTRVDVANNSGSVLPSTGGIGTTIFYVVGGVLVLAAIILLVTKKRMSE